MDARLYTGTQLSADRRAHLQRAAELDRVRRAAYVSIDPVPNTVFIRWRSWWRLASFRSVSPAR